MNKMASDESKQLCHIQSWKKWLRFGSSMKEILFQIDFRNILTELTQTDELEKRTGKHFERERESTFLRELNVISNENLTWIEKCLTKENRCGGPSASLKCTPSYYSTTKHFFHFKKKRKLTLFF